MASNKQQVDDATARILAMIADAQRKAQEKAQRSQNPYISSFSDILGKQSSLDDFSSLLNGFGLDEHNWLTPSQMKDWNKQLVETLLQYQLTKEGREYNEGLRDEQRTYDDPTNQLARLTGAGIGRDTAISMLSGGQQPISAEPSSVVPGIPASQSSANAMQTALAPLNTLFSAASAIGGLVSLGVSIPQAVEQTKALKTQNVMTSEVVNGLNAVNAVGNSIAGLVANGTLTTQDLNGFTDGNQVLDYINDHRGTNAFAPLFADGGPMQTLLGTRSGRDMFNQYWQSTLGAKHSGKIIEQNLRLAEQQEVLGELDTAAKRRDFFMNFQQQWRALLQQDAELALLAQQYRNGEIEIKINGQVLQQQRYNTKRAGRVNAEEQVRHNALMDVLENGAPAEPDANSTGQDIMTYNIWSHFYQNMCHDLAASSTDTLQPYNAKYGSPAERTMKSAWNSYEVNATGILLQKAMNEGRLDKFTGNAAPLYQFFDAWSACGAKDAVSSASDATGAAATAVKVLPKLIP